MIQIFLMTLNAFSLSVTLIRQLFFKTKMTDAIMSYY